MYFRRFFDALTSDNSQTVKLSGGFFHDKVLGAGFSAISLQRGFQKKRGFWSLKRVVSGEKMPRNTKMCFFIMFCEF